MPKRKRDQDTVSFKIASGSSAHGPLLASFPSLQAPDDTPFKIYGSKNDNSRPTLLVGETPAVEFVSNDEETKRAADSGCNYLLAVHNKRTSSLTIFPTSKSPYILTRTVKALKSSASASDVPSLAYREARTALGETFGTKKAKAAIRAQERNHVDLAAMQGVMKHVTEGIDDKAGGLLTKEEAKDLADSTRLIPPFNSATSDPSQIYLLNEIIPDAEYKALNVHPFEEILAGDAQNDLISILPWKHSKWVNNHLRHLGQSINEEENQSTKACRRKLKIILYISTMFLFRRVISHSKGSTGMSKETVHEKMNQNNTLPIPSIAIDGLLNRFTERTRGSDTNIPTSATSTKLLSYLLALSLRIDDFASNPKVLADDLSMSVTSLNQSYLSLGCKLKALSPSQLASRGLSDSLADTKFAVLSAPVKFPAVRTRRKRG